MTRKLSPSLTRAAASPSTGSRFGLPLPRRSHVSVILLCVGVAFALGCGDESYCDSLCDDVRACGGFDSFDECTASCEDELDVAREVGGGDCVAARKDYLDCGADDFCADVGFGESLCLMDVIEGEIEACGEALGEW